jgi:hypothetical protein
LEVLEDEEEEDKKSIHSESSEGEKLKPGMQVLLLKSLKFFQI